MVRTQILCLAVLALFAMSAIATNEEGTKYLEENKNKEGVVTLASGLQYKVIIGSSRRLGVVCVVVAEGSML